MRASERSRRRQLLLGKALRGIAEPLFLWHDQQELYVVSVWLVLRPAWLDCDFALFSFTPSPFLLSSLLFLCSLTAAHRFGRIFHFGMFGPIIPWTPTWAGFRRRLPGPWPSAWTRDGVELNCELNVSYVFSFVESGCVVDDRPSYPRVKGMCTDVDGYGLCVLS